MPDLLASFHRQIRLGVGEGSPRSERTWVDGLARVVSTDPQDPWAMVDCPNGLGADPDARIARERDHFVGLGLALEWKTYSYDEPADLGARLLAAGFAKEDDEALMLGELADLVGNLDLPPGVVVRPLRTTGDVRRVRELYHHVWGGSWGGAGGDLAPAHANLCGILNAQKQYAAAEGAGRKAIELAADAPLAWSNLSSSLIGRKRIADA